MTVRVARFDWKATRMEAMMSEPMRLARLEEYEASLPNGLASYPECKHKAAFFRDFIEHFPVARIAPKLPKPLRDLVEQRPAASAWLPEVHTNAFYLATCDLLFDTEQELFDALYGVNMRVLATPLNRIMFMVASPRVLLNATGNRWFAFHRGSQVTTKAGRGGGLFLLAFPEHLFPVLMLECYTRVFQAVLDVAEIRGGIALAGRTTTSANYDVSWY